MAFRWRREDYDAVKHDKCFSDWKVLVGPLDWKDDPSGKEGADRFLFRNLPSANVGPGVYELGVTVPAWQPMNCRSDGGLLKSEDVVVVYVSHSDNIRKRLQQYGQVGANLEGPRSPKPLTTKNDLANKSLKTYVEHPPRNVSTGEVHASCHKQIGAGDRPKSTRDRHLSLAKNNIRVAEPVSPELGGRGLPRGPRLFSEVFALGCSIAFRWASTESKEVAEFVVSELMEVFDYAWNRLGNYGVRSQDILSKIVLGKQQYVSAGCCFGYGLKRSRRCVFMRKGVGITICAKRPIETRDWKRGMSMRGKACGFFMFLKKSPQLLTIGGKAAKHCEFTKLDIPVERCGVLLENGLVCNALPLKGRKRCLMHKDVKRRSQYKPSRVVAPEEIRGRQSESGSLRSRGQRFCFPFLIPKKLQLNGHQKLKQRGSVSFNTWLSRSELLKAKI